MFLLLNIANNLEVIDEVGKTVKLADEYKLLELLINKFQGIFSSGINRLKGPAITLFIALVIIEIAAIFLLNWGNGDQIQILVKKVLKYGFVLWIINDYSNIINWVLQGFTWIGVRAGSSTFAGFLDAPDVIINGGINLSDDLTNRVLNSLHLNGFPAIEPSINPIEFIENVKDALINYITAIPLRFLHRVIGEIIKFCFFIVALNLIITFLEFNMMATLSLIFIPFAANQYTSFLAQKIGNLVYAYGIKLMVLAFIASASLSVFTTYILPPVVSIKFEMALLFAALLMAYLSWHAPRVAAAFMSGSPNFSVNSAANDAKSVASSVSGAIGM